ncbi:hypothetical protein [Streptomyces atratus]|uniref:hypothetical protein n=1 Tax=Streptomyces atratus TaxID=1893 RepID=UPI003F53E9DE
MRVLIVTESFPPDVNAVAHCTLPTARHLAARGHGEAGPARVRVRLPCPWRRLCRNHPESPARGLALGAPPGREPQEPPPSRADSLLWLATAGTGWLVRRSTDLLPQLLGLAGAEVRHWARGTSGQSDRRADQALRGALAAVSPQGRHVASSSSVPRVSMEG